MRREAATPGPGMHPDHGHGVDLLGLRKVEVRVERLVTDDLRGSRVQEIGPEVGLGIAAAMPIRHEYRRGAPGEETVHHGIDVGGQQLLSGGIEVRSEIERGGVVLS